MLIRITFVIASLWAVVCPVNAFAQTATSEPAATHDPWVKVADKHGIKVYEQRVPNRELPRFKAVGLLPAGLMKAVHVLRDVEGFKSWVPNCQESKLLWEKGFRHVLIYQRFSVPWPLWDRDLILEVRGRANDDRTRAVITYRERLHVPPPIPARTIRIPYLRGSYTIQQLGENRSRIEYIVDAHLGGSLPNWALKWVAQDLPYKTLLGLRKRLEKPK